VNEFGVHPHSRRYNIGMENKSLTPLVYVQLSESIPASSCKPDFASCLPPWPTLSPMVTLAKTSKPEVGSELGTPRRAKTVSKVCISDVTPNTPLRLEVAARLAFPGEGITAAGLRRERGKGRLRTESIAGKEFTTLAACRTEFSCS
jgi:hypothetical protein